MGTIVNGYASRDLVKSGLGIAAADTTDDALLERTIARVSRRIDTYTGRTFYVETGIRYATVKNGVVRIPGRDILSVSALKTSPTNDRLYTDVWAATDYDLLPFGADLNGFPFEEIVTRSGGDYGWPSVVNGVQVTGTFGFPNTIEDTLATLAEALDASETGVDVSSGAIFAVGDRILVESEQMLVTAISSNTLTVIRGINGTTAATHSTSLAISRYRVHEDIEAACQRESARRFKLDKEALFGVSGASPDWGSQSVGAGPYKWDTIVRDYLAPFKKWVVA